MKRPGNFNISHRFQILHTFVPTSSCSPFSKILCRKTPWDGSHGHTAVQGVRGAHCKRHTATKHLVSVSGRQDNQGKPTTNGKEALDDGIPPKTRIKYNHWQIYRERKHVKIKRNKPPRLFKLFIFISLMAMGCRERKVQFHSSGWTVGTVFWCTAPVMSINTPTKVYRSFRLWLCRLCWCQKILYRLGWMRPCDKLPINWCGATGFQPQHLLHCSTQSHVMPQYTHQSFRVIIAFRPHLTNILAWTANSTESHGRVALTVQVKDGNQVGSPLVSHGVGQVALDLESPMSHEGWGAKAYCWWFLDSSAICKAPYSSGIKLKSWWPDGWMMEERLNDGSDMLELWL